MRLLPAERLMLIQRRYIVEVLVVAAVTDFGAPILRVDFVEDDKNLFPPPLTAAEIIIIVARRQSSMAASS